MNDATIESTPPRSEEESKAFDRRSFAGLTVTQFLGAFNDNLYKQIVLLMAVTIIPAVAAAGGKKEVGDVQGWAQMVFALPFVLLSGVAGYLSDRYSKQRIIVLCKIAEIGVMLLALVAFLAYGWLGSYGTWLVLFLMATQSAFFGPGKYGILPELFPSKDLPLVNGLILMTTFLAVIFGVVLAGMLGEAFIERQADGTVSASNIWVISLICIGIAVAGTIASLFIRKTSRAQPGSKFSSDDWGVSVEVRWMLWNDLPLFSALLVSCVFWMVSAVAMSTVNRLGLDQLELTEFKTSVLVGSIGIGIIIGSILVAVGLRGVTPRMQSSLGLWGIIIAVTVLGIWRAGGQHLLGFSGSIIFLLMVGASAAIFSIPVQVFLQDRPPRQLKGRMIATMNQANFIGILLAGPIYQLFEWIARLLAWPVSSIFWMMGLCLLPLALVFRLGGSRFQRS